MHRPFASWLVPQLRSAVLGLGLGSLAAGSAGVRAAEVTNAVVLAIEHRVEVARFGAQVWDPAYVQPTNQVLRPGDRLRTGPNSRALLRLSNLTDFPVGELTQLELAREPQPRVTLRLLRGVLYFFHRDRPGDFQLDTPTVSAVVRGTEFSLAVADDGTSTFRVVDGEVELSNAFGSAWIRSGEEGVAAAGQAPVRTAVVTMNPARAAQWCLYYPGLLHLDELALDADEPLARSLAEYRSGDLLAALAAYPEERQPASAREGVYRAALLLAVGQAERAQELMTARLPDAGDPGAATLAAAVQTLIQAVTLESATRPGPGSFATNSPTAWLAESYAQQSRFQLEAARAAARQAAGLAPDFAFAWTQLAELEFGFGRTEAAQAALATSLRLAPRNAQALALQGFLLAAGNRTVEAIEWFDRARLADGALGNAWLGRGLCRIRQGDVAGGRQDLLVAATLEPQRAVLRSYLGKAFSLGGDPARALHELDLARQLDPRDPTARLYGALIQQQQNRINEAVRDLEESAALNDNRRVYRSRLLLDQDRAVRGADLAGVYADAGLADASLREAARAVNADYANYSAHLFLGASYNALRDPSGYQLRYETPWLNEYLVANLLAPAAAGVLSAAVSQQEYGRLFERNRAGLVSSTEYGSGGAWTENAVHYGIFGQSSYTLEAAYRSDDGSRPNNDLEALTLTAKLKQQLTLRDDLFLQLTGFTSESGDLAQYYYETNAQAGLRVKETQEPLLLTGWHHAWSPGSHTLLFGGYWRDVLSYTDPAAPVLLLRRGVSGQIAGVPVGSLPTSEAEYRSVFQGGTLELQHILQADRHTLVAGARAQAGEFDTRSELGESTPTMIQLPGTNLVIGPYTTGSGYTNQARSDFSRLSLYAYEHWRVLDPLLLVVGVSYDRLQAPVNFRNPPVAEGEETTDQFSPKAGLIWTPAGGTTLRGAYTRSLGGVSFDQSLRLEPSQVAGFNQSFRSLIPESAGGTLSGAKFETGSLSLEQKLGRGTYLAVQAEWLHETAANELGDIELVSLLPPQTAANSLRNDLDYHERNLALTGNQLIGKCWSVGARYWLSDARLENHLEDVPASLSPAANGDVGARLHQVNLFARFAHRSGWFGEADTVWLHQASRGYSSDLPDSDFWQINLSAGCRFFDRRLEARLGVLNLTDQSYQLNPLNLMAGLPQERTLVASLRFAF